MTDRYVVVKERSMFVVVGGSLAGLRAVETARTSGYDGPVTLVGAEPHLPYDRPPLSKAFLEPGAEATVFRTEEHLRTDLGVDLRLGAPATRLDPAAKSVFVDDEALRYDALVIATGSTPVSLPGTRPMNGLHTLRTLDDARAIRDALHAKARVVVIGAGFIGSEIAAAAAKYGNPVTIVEAAPVPLVRAAGPLVGAALARIHAREGTDVRLGTTVTSVNGESHVESVTLSDGTTLPADLVVVGIGSRPATGWLAGSGVELDEHDGGVRCDEYLATSVPDVYAAGDVAHFPNDLLGVARMRMENWTGAAEQGIHAARNALHPEERKPYATVPYVWSDWYSHRLQFVGHPATDEVRVVLGDLDGPKFVALYRDGDRVAGAVALNEPGKVMKYRRLISKRAPWQEATTLYPAS